MSKNGATGSRELSVDEKNYNYKRRGRKKEVGLRWLSASRTADGKSLATVVPKRHQHLQPFMLLTLEYNQTLSTEALNLT